MFTIIGSGFGLYGYLPAIVEELGETVLLPLGYKTKVMNRPELAYTLSAIHWVDDEKKALSLASAVVVATPPQYQFRFILDHLNYSNLEMFILEKPLATTPVHANELITKLNSANKTYRISYTLLYTAWFRSLTWPNASSLCDMISIKWTFTAFHFENEILTWKRSHQEGGGILRFYGIHLIALLAYYGYQGVKDSIMEGENITEPECWRAVFFGIGLPDCQIYVNSRSTEKKFEIAQYTSGNKQTKISLPDPFAQENTKPREDTRIIVLQQLLKTFKLDNHDMINYYASVNDLWQKVENHHVF